MGRDLACDLETTGLRPEEGHEITALGLASGNCEPLPDGSPAMACWVKGDMTAVKKYLAHRPLTVHKADFEGRWAEHLGVSWRDTTGLHDTLLLSKRAYPGFPASLEALTARFLQSVAGYKADSERELHSGLDWGEVNRGVLLERCALDAWVLPRLRQLLEVEIGQEGLAYHHEDVACALDVMRMTKRGICFDVDLSRKLEIRLEWEKAQALDDLHLLMGTEVKPGSPKLGLWFEEELGLEMTKRTDEDAPSTDAAVMARLSHDHPGGRVDLIARAISRYRTAEKACSTYVVGYRKWISEDTKRIHADMRVPGTVTWRPASSDPNILNFPKRPPSGHLRRLLVAPPGYVVMKTDYSQAELRINAALSGCKFRVDAYARGADLHQETADASKVTRDFGKNMNFTLDYGGGINAFGSYLEKQGIFLEKGKLRWYVAQFRKLNPELVEYMQAIKTEAFAPTAAMRWSISDYAGRKSGEDPVLNLRNAPSQFTPARWISRVVAALPEIEWVLHEYDGGVAFLPEDHALELAKRVKDKMEEVSMSENWIGSVPMPADVALGKNWWDLKEVC